MARSAAVAAVFDPVAPPTTFEETVERLGNAIKLGLLQAGTRLPPERELADQLGISRSTLRQALTTLVQSGYLVSIRGRSGGTFVTDEPPLAARSDVLGGGEAWSVLDYRVAVEVGAVTLAVERSDTPDLDPLDALVDRMAGSDDFDEYRRADMRFHIGVAEAAHSPRLVRAMTEVQGQMSDLIALIPHPEQVLTRSNAQHHRLVTLLRRRDRSRAVALVRQHIEGTEHILAGLLPPNLRLGRRSGAAPQSSHSRRGAGPARTRMGQA
jgi:GntR family transcriptional regulator, transcriptional repressor for pyruvate dehydrogenase complex